MPRGFDNWRRIKNAYKHINHNKEGKNIIDDSAVIFTHPLNKGKLYVLGEYSIRGHMNINNIKKYKNNKIKRSRDDKIEKFIG